MARPAEQVIHPVPQGPASCNSPLLPLRPHAFVPPPRSWPHHTTRSKLSRRVADRALLTDPFSRNLGHVADRFPSLE